MIFAAGFGTRMMPLTEDRPKPMVPLLDRPMIDHALDHARAVDPERVVINTHYKSEVLEAHLADSGVVLVDEQPDILDTGGGLRNALPALGEGPVWTLNPDTVWIGPNPLEYLLDHWDGEKMDALLLCADPNRAEGTNSNGDFELSQLGQVTRGAGVIYGGAQIVDPSGLHAISDTAFSLNTYWDQLIAAGRCYGIVYPGSWCDIGHPEGLRLAERLLRDYLHV
jgi:MurNAc alpha-1-phosphate uridylyltransferase